MKIVTAALTAVALSAMLVGVAEPVSAQSVATTSYAASTSAQAPALRAQPDLIVHTGGYVTKHPVPHAYPYPHTVNPNELDPWGMYKRQCTSYVAWFLNASGVNFGYLTRGPSGKVGTFANASTWRGAALKAGYKVSKFPRVGAVAQWNVNETSRWTINGAPWWFNGGPVGHVAIVTHVYSDGTAQISEYNLNEQRTYSSIRVKAPRYLYIGFRHP